MKKSIYALSLIFFSSNLFSGATQSYYRSHSHSDDVKFDLELCLNNGNLSCIQKGINRFKPYLNVRDLGVGATPFQILFALEAKINPETILDRVEIAKILINNGAKPFKIGKWFKYKVIDQIDDIINMFQEWISGLSKKLNDIDPYYQYLTPEQKEELERSISLNREKMVALIDFKNTYLQK